jgi:hypothetical protein
MAGSVVLHSTLATRELSSFCSHPPSSANQGCSNAPAALHSSLSRPSSFTRPSLTHYSAALRPPLRHSSLPPFVPPRGQPPLVELQLVQPRENSYPVSTPRRASVAIREVANPPTKRRTATSTISSSNGTPTDLLPIPLRTFDTRQATTRPTWHVTSITSCNSGTPKYNRSSPTSFRSLNVQLTPVKQRLAQLRIQQPTQTSPRTTKDTTASPSYSLTNSPWNSPSQSPSRQSEGG